MLTVSHAQSHTDNVAATRRHSATMFLALPRNFINKIA